jgi:Ni,Fe-hydrogenase maturation factor
VIAPSARRKVASGRLRILTFEEITKKLERGEYQKHAFPLGFVITQISEYENERVLDVMLLLGERFEEWKAELVAHLNAFAKVHGCKAIEAISRLGLEKALKDQRFRKSRVVLRREVE